ncbi:hypothetical protein RchiOBHm_Chr1g0339081 [Rosa chinensis]|uniref:Secreted protein n=1 Tax=Rosa chinensis TaxID=74649 RepID=A0A2P6SD44_ROSCH|nr:hypothetical protein RchiOBHm_Chr1g0339081 [Rosa chinensis]
MPSCMLQLQMVLSIYLTTEALVFYVQNDGQLLQHFYSFTLAFPASQWEVPTILDVVKQCKPNNLER